MVGNVTYAVLSLKRMLIPIHPAVVSTVYLCVPAAARPRHSVPVPKSVSEYIPLA